MNLIIDVGNTLVKLGVFEKTSLQYRKKCVKKDFLQTLSEVGESYPLINFSMISSVGNLSDHQFKKLKQKYPIQVLSSETKVPFNNKYTTPSSLGGDRIALVSAAAMQYPSLDVLVIDAGTCITYDFLTKENNYMGGGISPGIAMRYNALHTYTARLPLLDISVPKKLIGDSTAHSIHSGIMNGVLYEINGFITKFKENYPNLTVILTGGDAHFLRDSLKNDIFANSNFLLEGLNYILEHNKL